MKSIANNNSLERVSRPWLSGLLFLQLPYFSLPFSLLPYSYSHSYSYFCFGFLLSLLWPLSEPLTFLPSDLAPPPPRIWPSLWHIYSIGHTPCWGAGFWPRVWIDDPTSHAVAGLPALFCLLQALPHLSAAPQTRWSGTRWTSSVSADPAKSTRE